MDLEAALKRIKELEDKTADLEEKLYKANAFINELLLKLQNQKEKTNIAIIKQFESKTEKIDKIVIDEVEEIVAKQKKAKSTNKSGVSNKCQLMPTPSKQPTRTTATIDTKKFTKAKPTFSRGKIYLGM